MLEDTLHYTQYRLVNRLMKLPGYMLRQLSLYSNAQSSVIDDGRDAKS